MRTTRRWLCTVITAALALAAASGAPIMAQPDSPTLTVGTGSEMGTYHQFFLQIQNACSLPPLQESISKGGTPENIEKLLTNKVSIAFVQADGLLAARDIDKNEDIDYIRTLLTLYPEEVHLLTLASGRVHSFQDLGNKRVGTHGGASITSRVLFATTGVRPAELRVFQNAGDTVAALDKGEIAALISVGGQPLEFVQRMGPGRYRLVPLEIVSKMYTPAVLSYRNLSPTGIKTVAVSSLLVTLDYKSPRMVVPVSQLRQCITDNLLELRETPGNHMKWRLVNAENRGPWPWYAPPVKTSPAKPAKK